MRHGRAKQTRKTLQFYERTIANFPRPGHPYHILLDGTFIVTAMKYNIPFYERMVRLLGCPVHHQTEQPKNGSNNHRRTRSPPGAHVKPNLHFYVCSSTILELQTLLERQPPATTGTHQQSSSFVAIEKAIEWCKSKNTSGYDLKILERAKNMEVVNAATKHDATQDKAFSPAAEDIWHHLMRAASSASSEHGNDADSHLPGRASVPSHKHVYYMIATQDPQLLYRCRSQRSPIPILRFGDPKSGCVLLLDPPSHKAASNANYNERVKWFHHANDPPPTASSASSDRGRKESDPLIAPSKQRVVKKAKGPNPLSCKKKRSPEGLKNATTEQRSDEPKRKRRRKSNEKNTTPTKHTD